MRRGDREVRAGASAALLCFLCVCFLCWMCTDSKRYHERDGVMVSGITYTPPKSQEPPGVWEIFEEALKSLAFWE